LLAAEIAAGVLGEHSVDGILDSVAGALFGRCVAALRPGGVLSLVGSVGGSAVSLDADYLLDAVLTGYTTERLDGAVLRRAVATIGDWLRHGALRPPARTLFPARRGRRRSRRLGASRCRGSPSPRSAIRLSGCKNYLCVLSNFRPLARHWIGGA